MSDLESIGPRGEAIAIRYLNQIGCRILARNFRHRKGEIDIIAIEGAFLIIVEVKSRSTLSHGDPETAIDCKKIELLSMAAGFFQELHNIRLEIRFDIITVHFPKNKKARLAHFRDAFHA
ncbi:MAG: YraN family protein [Bacteroidia bacterium]|nr:YraN family protein [Bacteroidia bacterium]